MAGASVIAGASVAAGAGACVAAGAQAPSMRANIIIEATITHMGSLANIFSSPLVNRINLLIKIEKSFKCTNPYYLWFSITSSHQNLK